MHKSVKAVLITLGVIFILLIAVIIIAIAAQKSKLEQDIGNPIINSNYQGWVDISLDDNVRIKLPQEWNLEKEDEKIFIKDCCGAQIAVGAKLPDRSIETDTVFLGQVFGSAVLKNQAEQFSNHSYGNMATAWFSVCEFEGNKTKKFVSIQLPYYSYYTYRFCFFSDSNETFLCDEAEAIAYSMSYS